MNRKQKFWRSSWLAFAIGGIIAALLFGGIHGWPVVDPWNLNWIWHGVTHDTAQHYLGWAFFAKDSTGGIINGLAYPYGLSIVFMDSIPLLAFLFKWLGVGANIQYFGLWALSCFVLMGGLSAVLLRRIWLKVFGKDKDPHVIMASIFGGIGSIIFTLSPMVLARTLYHPALAGQWLILLAFLVIWDSRTRRITQHFTLIWTGLLVLSVLIHPYFLPMMAAMLLTSLVRAYPVFKSEALQLIDIKIDTKKRKISWRREWHRVIPGLVLRVAIPVSAAGLVFWAIGGSSLGGGAEVYDLSEKGFNLLSFFNSMGYSAVVPPFANASSSPETLMWLGLGVLVGLIAALLLWIGNYRRSLVHLAKKFGQHRGRYVLYILTGLALLIFAIGVRVDLGPITLFSYEPLVPKPIYELWTAFRAAAREAWPFYYLTILAIIYWLLSGIYYHRKQINKLQWKMKSEIDTKLRHISINIGPLPLVALLAMGIVVAMQYVDILNSLTVKAKREGFTAARMTEPEFKPLDLSSILSDKSGKLLDSNITKQDKPSDKAPVLKHLVALDGGFRGDQSGTYIIGQTALKHNMTLNTGFFARVPDKVKADQTTWRNKLAHNKATDVELQNNLFFTKDADLANRLSNNYTVAKIGDYYFIY